MTFQLKASARNGTAISDSRSTWHNLHCWPGDNRTIASHFHVHGGTPPVPRSSAQPLLLLATGLDEVYIGRVCVWVNRCILSWFRHRRSSAADVDDDGSQCDVSATHPGHILLSIMGSTRSALLLL